MPTALFKSTYSYTTTLGSTGMFFGLWQPGMSKYRGGDNYTKPAAANFHLVSMADGSHYANPSSATWAGIIDDRVNFPAWFTSWTGWGDIGNKWY